jgi:hypothetical protein
LNVDVAFSAPLAGRRIRHRLDGRLARPPALLLLDPQPRAPFNRPRTPPDRDSWLDRQFDSGRPK